MPAPKLSFVSAPWWAAPYAPENFSSEAGTLAGGAPKMPPAIDDVFLPPPAGGAVGSGGAKIVER